MSTLSEPHRIDLPPAARHRGWLRFSLRSLLFFTILTVLIVSHWNTTYQSRREKLQHEAITLSLKQEIAALRAELGYFSVDPPDRVHVLGIPQVESGHYLWRVHLPEGTKWKLKLEAAHSEGDGGISSSTHTSQLEGGEFLLHVKLYRTEDGAWKVGLMLPNRTSTASLQANCAFGAKSFSTTASVAGRPLERRDADKPIKLLHLVGEATAPRSEEKPSQNIKDEIRVILQPDTPPAATPSEIVKPALE